MTPQRADNQSEAVQLTIDEVTRAPMVSNSSLVLFAWLSALLALFVAAPNFGVVPTIRVVDVLLIAAAVYSAVRRPREDKPAAITIVLAGFLGLTAVSAVIGLIAEHATPSPYRNVVFGGTALGPLQVLLDQIAAIAAFAILVASRLPTDTDKRAGFRFGLEAAASCVAVLCAMELVHDHSFGARIDAGFGNPNLLASFLVMCWPVLAAGIFSTADGPSVSRRIMRALGAIVLLGAVWYTGSRGALLGLGVSAGLLGVTWAMRRFNSAHVSKAVVCCLLMIVVGAGAIVVRHGSALGGISHTRSDQQRLVVWHAAATIAKSHPLLGVGLGAFPAAMWNLHLREPNPATASGLPLTPAVHLHAHNIFLQYAAERGLPGLCAIVILLAVLLATVLSPHRLRSGHVFQIACGFGLVGLLVQNLFDYTLWYAPLLILAWCLAAVTMGRPNHTQIVLQNLVLKLADEPTEAP